MKKLLLSICAIFALFIAPLHGYANPSSDEQTTDSNKQSEGYSYVRTVNVYIIEDGEFKADGIADLFKNLEGELFVKSRYGLGYRPVLNTIHQYSKDFKYYYMDYNQFFFDKPNLSDVSTN